MLFNISQPILIATMLFSVLASHGQTQPQNNGGGSSGGAYNVGGAVSAPRPTYSPGPEYSEEARKAKLQGTCVLWMIVDADGSPHDIRVTHPLGLGLDEKAIEAVRTWRFEPGKKDA
jgi:TonB family protein